MDEFEKEKRLIDLDRERTELKKKQFIKEIREGLGEHIKKSGNKIKKIKKSWWRRFLDKLIKVF
jgi:hypothetical protein